jgi:Histidine phosphatase superfamily (branch 1)
MILVRSVTIFWIVRICGLHPTQLAGEKFNTLFHSPLERARRTAEIIWSDRHDNISVLPSLREIDLYSFQVGPPIHASFHPYPCIQFSVRLSVHASVSQRSI